MCTYLCERALCQGNCFWTATPLFPKMPKQLPTHVLFLCYCKRPCSTGHVAQIPLGWMWSIVKCIAMMKPSQYFVANLKVSCLDLGFWERGSSSFLLGTALVKFLQLSRQSEKDSQDYKDHVSMVILIRNLTCSRIDRSKKQNQASRMIYFSSSPRK